MSIVYSGVHSITFIKPEANDTITVKRSWLDWHLVPSSRPHIVEAAPNISIVPIPGTNRSIDLTESLTGSISYARRTGSWEFVVDHDRWDSWTEAKREIGSFLNGQRLYCVLEDEPDVAYYGRFTLSDWKSDSDYSRITVKYDVDHDEIENEFDYSLTLYPQSVSATFLLDANSSKKIVNTDTLNDLRKYTKTEITYDNGYTEESDKYTSTGDLPTQTAGTKSITIRTVERDYYEAEKTTSINVPVVMMEIDYIVADFKPKYRKIYQGMDIELLRQYLTVTVVWTDGSEETVTDYTLSGDLSTSGTKTITVSYSGKTTTFTVIVFAVTLVSISSVYDSSHTVLVGDTLDSLKPYLTVTAHNSNGTAFEVTSYTLSGSLSNPGTTTITVSYNGKTATVSVLVAVLESISAAYNSSHTVFAGDSLDSLKPYLTVTGHSNNGSTFTVTGYTLSGSLSSSGTKTVTVSYSGITTTFTVTVLGIQSISATFDSSHKAAVNDSLDSLKPYLIVDAYADNQISRMLGPDDYTLSGDLTTVGSETISVQYRGKSDTFTVIVVGPIQINSNHTTLQSGEVNEWVLGSAVVIGGSYVTVEELNENYYPMINFDSANVSLLRLHLLRNGTDTVLSNLTDGNNQFRDYEYGTLNDLNTYIGVRMDNPSNTDVEFTITAYAVPR